MRKMAAKTGFNSRLAVLAATVLGLGSTIGGEADAADPAFATNVHCRAPDIPAKFVASEFPRDAAIFEGAVRRGDCEFIHQLVAVTPVRFVGKVKAGSESVEPYGYIWAIRLLEGEVRYWFFWKAEHEAMLMSVPGI